MRGIEGGCLSALIGSGSRWRRRVQGDGCRYRSDAGGASVRGPLGGVSGKICAELPLAAHAGARMSSIRPPGPARSPRRRASRRVCASVASRWFNLLWLLPIGFVVSDRRGGGREGAAQHAVGGALHRPLPRHHRVGRRASEPGSAVWVGVQHFFNLFLLIFIIRSGVQILSDHPRLYWTRHSTPGKDWFRVQKPVPAEPLWTAKQDSISLPGQVGLPGIGTPSGWPAGGISVPTSCGC